MSVQKRLLEGVWQRNPVLVRVLGVAPLLAVADTLVKAVAVAALVFLVLLVSAVLVSVSRNLVPMIIRLPVYALILATVVTCVDYLAAVYFPEFRDAMGLYLPVVAASALLFSRLEEFASAHAPAQCILDSVAQGLGYLLAGLLLGACRELLAYGSLFRDAGLLLPSGAGVDAVVLFPVTAGLPVAADSAGGFLILGLIIAVKNALAETRAPVPDGGGPREPS